MPLKLTCCDLQDFYGGHIKGAIHWESDRFCSDADIDDLIDSHLQSKSRVVLHCMMSQIRGPRCAHRLSSRLLDRGTLQPNVLVMSGGFQRFSRLYGKDEQLVEQD